MNTPGVLLGTKRTLGTKRNFIFWAHHDQDVSKMASASDSSMELSLFLTVAGLDHYEDAFNLAGVTSAQTLFGMTHEELNDLAMKMNMPGDDLSQLQVQIYCQKIGPLSPISPIPVQQTPEKWTPIIGQPVVPNAGHNAIVGHNSSSSWASPSAGRDSSCSGHYSSPAGHNSSPAGHNPSPVPQRYATPLRSHQLGVQRQKQKKLELVLKTYKEVKLTSYDHSSDMHKSCMLDNAKSGSRTKIFRCRSVLSKKFKDITPPVCNYCLHWSKKQGSWQLNADKSTLKHAPLCCSQQRVTQFQLKHDAQFVKHVSIEKHVSGKAAAHHALGGKRGRLAGSVESYTARRARLSIQNFSNTD